MNLWQTIVFLLLVIDSVVAIVCVVVCLKVLYLLDINRREEEDERFR